MFLAALLLALVLHAVVVLPILLRLKGQHSPVSLAGNMIPALSTALATGMPMATLPVTQRCVVRNSKVDYRAAAAVLPLGSGDQSEWNRHLRDHGGHFRRTGVGRFIRLIPNPGPGARGLVSYHALRGFSGATMLLMVLAMDLVGFPEVAFGALALIAAVEWLALRSCAVVDVWSSAVGASVVAKTFSDTATRRRPIERPVGHAPARVGADRERPPQRDRQRGRDGYRDGDRGRRRPDRGGDRPQRGQRSRWSRPERSGDQPAQAGTESRRSPFEIKGLGNRRA